MAMGFQFDESGWPIVYWRWTGTVTDREVLDGLTRMDGYLQRAQRFGVIIDARGGGGLSPEQRHRVIAHMKVRADLTARWLVQAVLFDTLVQRTLYYGVHLLFPLGFPSKVFSDLEAARAWLTEMVGPADVR
jgi:hypothetical protein